MTTISLTLTDRQYDGYVIAANGAGMTPDALLSEFVSQQGAHYANDFRVGIITGAAFVARFTPQEYSDIMGAAASDEEVSGVVDQLTAAPTVALDDPRIRPGLELLVSKGLLDAARIPEIVSYQRPEPQGTDTNEPGEVTV